MLMLSLIVLGGTADSAITFYGMRRFGDVIESNPIIVWLHGRVGLLSSLAPLVVSLVVAALVWLFALSAVAYAFALIFWAPVPWNAYIIGRTLRRRGGPPEDGDT